MSNNDLNLLHSILEHGAEISHDLKALQTLNPELKEDLERLRIQSLETATEIERLISDNSRRQDTVDLGLDF